VWPGAARPWRIAVVGGGIAGLAAAVRLRDRAPVGTTIVVFEQSGALGGKIRTGELAGTVVERGAESFLVSAPATMGPGERAGPQGEPPPPRESARESAAVRLARRVGLGDALVHPTVGQAAIAVDGTLTPMPAGTLMGVPAEVSSLGSLAQVADAADRDGGRPLLGAGEDVAVGELVRRRLGDEVVDRLVDPMLGGVYAGRADRLSLAVTVPALAWAARTEHTLLGAVRAAKAAAPRVPGRPVFATVDGGLGRLVAAAAAASGATIHLGVTVRELNRTGTGWRLTTGPVPAPETADFDAVVLAVPAAATNRLLGTAPPSAGVSGGAALDYASVALVGFALPAGTALPRLSGFLVPAAEGTLVKAATFFTRKWAHLSRDGGPVIVRASIGRYGEEHRLQHDDATLIDTARADLGALLGAPLPTPDAAWVQRWGGGLPQYAPGHLDRVAALRATLPPGLALAGAGFDGVGIPACITSGENAADDVLSTLEESP
jgi:oxygen-dependent protoporphyrinogen oxidase